MRCPECELDVTPEVGFCFSCMKHVSSEPIGLSALARTSDRKRRFGRKESELVIEDALVAQYIAEEATSNVREWEPGIVGLNEAFGAVAKRSQWRRTASPAAGR